MFTASGPIDARAEYDHDDRPHDVISPEDLVGSRNKRLRPKVSLLVAS